MADEQYSLIEECTSSYVVTEQPDGGVRIVIDVPRRFKMLWLLRLTDLKASMREIDELENEDFDAR